MKRWHVATAQIAMAGPTIVLSPYAALMGGAAFLVAATDGARGNFPSLQLVGFGLGWIGLLGLLFSMLVTIPGGPIPTKVRIFVTVLLCCGFLASGILMWVPDEQSRSLWHNDLLVAWFFLGPWSVGIWNLIRMWHKPSS